MDMDTLRQVTQYTNKSVMDRQIDHLTGLSMGLIADGKIDQSEAEMLHKWLIHAEGASSNPVIQSLLSRTFEFLEDGVLDPDEAEELLSLLQKFVNGNYEIGEVAKSSALPLCEPAPQIRMIDALFTITGTCAFGPRTALVEKIEENGGRFVNRVNQSVDYVIIGTYVTGAWKHETFGRKIEKAMELRNLHDRPHIISEEHWLKSVGLLNR